VAMKSGVPGSVRRAVFRAGEYRCAECGIEGREQRFPRGGFGYPTPETGVYLSIDHILAKSRGGGSEQTNLRVLCTTCNTRKGCGDA
jgi:5-methylcytosine-specific restriction endonuclease McrA